ncbi:PREDICTED: major royal jelly protein 3-like [Wasmannia auropunctata]|uniref:major royal jelly protein 3-like n=1 Tax=Wasmannia auropunctata TaxID=64793 RepID=UPI0005EF8A47|nr:PREDICTED: major royal jelly protein 3-like [Wasmannia auropunctata]
MEQSLLALLILSMAITSFGIKVDFKKEWKYVDFEWDSPEQKIDAINSGRYDPTKCLLYDVDKARDGRLFVTAPREMGPDSPATLATVTNQIGPGGPILRPYPDWSFHDSSCEPNTIVNVNRVYIQCNHIFVLDNGKIGPKQVCNPKVLIFDLKDDTLVKTINIPLHIATNRMGSGYLVTPVVYVPGKCSRLLDEAIIIMAEMQGYGLVVYDSSTKRMCRIEADNMKPTDTFYSINGYNITYVGGPLGVTIIGDELYYSSISGHEIYKIKIKQVLQCPNKAKANKQIKLALELPSQVTALASVKETIFYHLINNVSIAGTNFCKKCNKKTVEIIRSPEKLQSTTGLKYSPIRDQLLGLADNFQRFVLGNVNINEINAHYFEIDVAEIREKTDLFSPSP